MRVDEQVIGFVHVMRDFSGRIAGGQLESDRQMDDLKQLYRIYLTEAFAGGRLEADKVQASILQLIVVWRICNRLYTPVAVN